MDTKCHRSVANIANIMNNIIKPQPFWHASIAAATARPHRKV